MPAKKCHGGASVHAVGTSGRVHGTLLQFDLWWPRSAVVVGIGCRHIYPHLFPQWRRCRKSFKCRSDERSVIRQFTDFVGLYPKGTSFGARYR